MKQTKPWHGAGRLLVFGGTGFLGSAVVRDARGRGIPVVSIARGNRRDSRGMYPDLIGDVTRAETLRGVVATGDVVLNLVGLSPVGRPRGGRRAYHAAHVTGAHNLARAADAVGAAALITVSALGVHRECGAAYGETKAQAERIVLTAATPSCVVAPSLLFGDGSEIVRGFDLLAGLPVPSGVPIPIPDVPACFRPIHVDDAARLIVDVAAAGAASAGFDSAAGTVVPLVGPELLTAYEIAARALTARGLTVTKIPSFLAGVLVALLSRLKLPGLPAELGAMLALDNAGFPPDEPDGLASYSRWVRER
jgi:uncharacterized protein YbjT (DUF2867 family)